MNCRNCGAASFTGGRCNYCWTVDDTQFVKDVETVAHAYFSGFISEEQRFELLAKLSMLRAGDSIILPPGVDISFLRV